MLGLIGSAISAVVSGVTSACSAIGGFIAKAAPIAVEIAKCLPVVRDIITAIGKILEIISGDTKPEDLGAAMQQCGKKPEDFETTKEYIKYLEEEIKAGRVDCSVNEDKTISTANAALGTFITLEGVKEQYDQIDLSFFKDVGPKFNEGKLNAQEVKSIIETADKNGVNPQEVGKYIAGEKPENIDSAKSTLQEAIKATDPSLSDQDLNAKIKDVLQD